MQSPYHLIITLITLFSSLIALVVAVVLGTYNRKTNLTSNHFLVALLVSMSVSGVLAAVTISGWIIQVPYLFRMSSPLHYAIPPLLYYYTKTSVYRGYKLKPWEWLLFLPALAHFLETLPIYLMDRTQKLAHIRYLLEVRRDVTLPLHDILKNGYSVVLTGLSFYVFRLYPRKAKVQQAPQNRIYNQWLQVLFGISGLYTLAWLVRFLFPRLVPVSAFTFNSLFSAAENLVGALFLLFRPQILYGALYENPSADPLPEAVPGPASPASTAPPLGESPPKYKSSPLTPEQKLAHFTCIQTYMIEQKPYLNKQLSLHEVSYDLNVSPHWVSQVINEIGGDSFADYVNAYRVQYAKALIASGRLDHLSIAGIGSESGFNSRATFYKAFKKCTSMTPTEYTSKLGLTTSAA